MIMMYLYLGVLQLFFICKHDYLFYIILLIKVYPNYLHEGSAGIINTPGFGSFTQIFVSCELDFYTGLILPENLFMLLARNYAAITNGSVAVIVEYRMDLLILAFLIKNLDCGQVLVRKIIVAEVKAFLEISVALQLCYHGLLVCLLFMDYLLLELRA